MSMKLKKPMAVHYHIIYIMNVLFKHLSQHVGRKILLLVLSKSSYQRDKDTMKVSRRRVTRIIAEILFLVTTFPE